MANKKKRNDGIYVMLSIGGLILMAYGPLALLIEGNLLMGIGTLVLGYVMIKTGQRY